VSRAGLRAETYIPTFLEDAGSVARDLDREFRGAAIHGRVHDAPFRRVVRPAVSYISLLTASEPGGNTREGPMPLALDSDREVAEVVLFSSWPALRPGSAALETLDQLVRKPRPQVTSGFYTRSPVLTAELKAALKEILHRRSRRLARAHPHAAWLHWVGHDARDQLCAAPRTGSFLTSAGAASVIDYVIGQRMKRSSHMQWTRAPTHCFRCVVQCPTGSTSTYKSAWADGANVVIACLMQALAISSG